MSDGKNEARALRILELMNDFRTLQAHIRAHITAPDSQPPSAEAQNLEGYVILRRCMVAAQNILATSYNPGSLGIVPGQMAATEVQKASLQRIILDAATRRFQAHKLYLQVSAARRWIAMRNQVLQGATPGPQHAAALRAVSDRLREELAAVSDAYAFNDLRNADRRKNYWLDEDPTLERMLAWARARS